MKKYKCGKFLFLCSFFILLFFLFSPITYARETPQEDFTELYCCQDLSDAEIKSGDPMTVQRMVPIGNHIYLAEPKIYKWPSIGEHSYTSYSLLKAADSSGWGFSGKLTSETARITAVYEWNNRENSITEKEVNYDKAFVLPEKINKSQYSYRGDKGELYQAEAEKKGCVFNTLGTHKKIGSHALQSPNVFTIIVEDKGIKTEYTLIIGHTSTDYQSAYNTEKGEHEYRDQEYFNVDMNIKLYDGTDGQKKELDKKYQYGEKLRWQSGKQLFGWEEGSLISNEKMEIPSAVKSLRLSYQEEMPEAKQAFFDGIPGTTIYSAQDAEADAVHNYYFYRSKSRMVCINGKENFNIYAGQKSPELPLKKGINVIFLAGTDTETAKQNNRHFRIQDDKAYVFLIYWDGKEGYNPSASNDTEVKKIDLYQAAYNEKESENKFSKIEINETKNNLTGELTRSIKLKSATPYLWINPITEDAAATVKIDGASNNLGGFLKKFTADENQFTIHVTSADGKNTSDIPIQVKWEGSRAELADLKAYANAKMSTAYDAGIRSYYAPRENEQDDVKFTFTLLKDTTVTVLVDRQEYMTVSSTQKQYMKLPADTREVQWKVISDNGKSTVYTVYMDRGKENGISDTTKQRAKKMIDNMVKGGYLKDIQENTSYTYWDIFGTAALGKQYLKGTLAYDVTKHECTKSTDYAAVILELIMAGENPYDYLGENYVDKLLSYDDGTGYFGDYSANIWALSALQAAGAPIPEKTITIVQKQAMNESFDLDMRGWALYAISLIKGQLPKDDYARCIQSFKEVQIQKTTSMNGIDVTGCFENFFYTNRNIMSHACLVSGLTSMGIDVGGKEFAGENGSDAVSVLENYQRENGGWIYSPENITSGGWNKDVTIAVGDLYNGTNVYTRYYLTDKKYKELLENAENLLNTNITDAKKKEALQKAYEEAATVAVANTKTGTVTCGKEYYALQSAIFSVDETQAPGVFIGTATERKQVQDVISSIKTIASYSYSDKEQLKKIQAQYESLKEERLYHYVTNKDVLDNAYHYIEKIDNFIEATEKIGKVNLTKTVKIQKARTLYDSLSQKQKEEKVVENKYSILIEAERKLAQAKTAERVVKAIENLGNIVTLDCQDDIDAVRKSYEALTKEQQNFVSNLDKLKLAEEKIQILQQQQKDMEAAANVTEQITSIGLVSQNSRGDIQKARDAYDRLSQNAKYMVENYQILLDSEQIYKNQIQLAELDAKVDKLSYLIGQVDEAYGEESLITTANEAAIKEAVQVVREYLEEQKSEYPYILFLTTDYSRLTDIEAELMEFTLSDRTEADEEEFREAISSVSVVSMDSAKDLKKAEVLYSLLTEQQQEDVEEAYNVMLQKQEQLTILQQNYDSVQEVCYAIVSLGEVTLSEKENYQDVELQYNSLDEDARNMLPQDIINMWKDDSAKYESLMETQKEIDEVVSNIDKAVEISNLKDEKIVTDARKIWASLNEKYKVTNYVGLLNAESYILNLKKDEENQQIASSVINKIEKLKNITLKDEENIQKIRLEYEELTDRQKDMVYNLAFLENAEEQIDVLKKQPPKQNKTSLKKETKKNPSIILKKKETKATKYLKAKKQKYTIYLQLKGKKVPTSQVSWKTDKKSVAVISKEGILTVKRKGEVIVTAKYKGKKYYYRLTVKKASLKLKKSTVVLKRGNVTRIKTICQPKSKVEFKSINPKIATVTKNGKVIAKKKGKTKIKVVANGIKRYFKVTVK